MGNGLIRWISARKASIASGIPPSLGCKENLKFSSAKMSVRFRRSRYVVKNAKKGQLAFLKHQQQVVHSGNKVSFPKTFYGLNFQLKYLNRSVSINKRGLVLAYTSIPSIETIWEYRRQYSKYFA